MLKIKKQLRNKFKDDIAELSKPLQHLLEKWTCCWIYKRRRYHLRNRRLRPKCQNIRKILWFGGQISYQNHNNRRSSRRRAEKDQRRNETRTSKTLSRQILCKWQTIQRLHQTLLQRHIQDTTSNLRRGKDHRKTHQKRRRRSERKNLSSPI